MLYDLSQAPPEPGSLLESAFLVLTKRRQEQEFLRTRVLAEATLAPHLEGDSKISETFDDYMNSMFPYLRHQTTRSETDMKKALKQWTGRTAFKVKPLWQASDSPKRFRSSLQRGKEKIAKMEELRRSGVLRRIK